jgi:hypothetical protein
VTETRGFGAGETMGSQVAGRDDTICRESRKRRGGVALEMVNVDYGGKA